MEVIIVSSFQEKGKPSAPTDFRLALLFFLSKALKKILQDQIYGYLAENAILNPRQTGFKQHISTDTALFRLTKDIGWNFDRRKMTILLYFDFSKAFDTISPSRLLKS